MEEKPTFVASRMRRLVYSVSSGMPAGSYLVFTGMDSLKALDPPPSAMSTADAFGADNLARHNKLLADTNASSESTMFPVNPKMSNPPKEYIAADPDFWVPKPKPVAAKPATKLLVVGSSFHYFGRRLRYDRRCRRASGWPVI